MVWEGTVKGFFPHLFNKPCNWDYVGRIPAKRYYDPKSMLSGDKVKFDLWYECNKDIEFNFMKELDKYCVGDVDILRRSMLKFRHDFMSMCNVDPLKFITIAGVAYATYSSDYMPGDTIAFCPEIYLSEKHSKISISWLDWISKNDIQHALNGGEKRLDDIGYVDGFNKETNTVYEFQGCFWHGCKDCFKEKTVNSVNQLEMKTIKETDFRKDYKNCICWV